MSTTNYIIKDTGGVATTLDASNVLWTMRWVYTFNDFAAFGAVATANLPVAAGLPVGAKMASVRLLTRTIVQGPGLGTAMFQLGKMYDGDNDAALVVNFDGRSTNGAQGTVGLLEPYTEPVTGIYLSLTITGILMDALTAGEVALQIYYTLPTV